jgi:hypothetical protein
MKTFLLTDKIDFPIDDFGEYDRKTYPQQYLKTIIEERIPDSRVIVSNVELIKNMLNAHIDKADEETKKYISDYEFAVNLAKNMGLINDYIVISTTPSQDSSRFEKKQKDRQNMVRE